MLWLLVLLPLIPLRWFLYRKDVKKHGQPYANRRVIRSVVVMLVFYGGILGLLLWLENRLVYHPLTVEDSWHPPSRINPQNVNLQSSMGDQIHAWWCPHPDADYTVLFSHGNAGNLASHSWLIPPMRVKVAFNVLIYDYPGYGRSTGVPGESSCYAAADAAYAWLTQTRKVPPQRLILFGQSLGCAMACELAKKSDHRALVLLSPFTSIRDLGQELLPIFPVKWIMRHDYGNRSKLMNYQKPLLIGHSTADEVIPYHHGQQLYESAGSPEKTFYRIDGDKHSALPDDFFEAMGEFVLKLK